MYEDYYICAVNVIYNLMNILQNERRDMQLLLIFKWSTISRQQRQTWLDFPSVSQPMNIIGVFNKIIPMINKAIPAEAVIKANSQMSKC
jgi:hypothetical protein